MEHGAARWVDATTVLRSALGAARRTWPILVPAAYFLWLGTLFLLRRTMMGVVPADQTHWALAIWLEVQWLVRDVLTFVTAGAVLAALRGQPVRVAPVVARVPLVLAVHVTVSALALAGLALFALPGAFFIALSWLAITVAALEGGRSPWGVVRRAGLLVEGKLLLSLGFALALAALDMGASLIVRGIRPYELGTLEAPLLYAAVPVLSDALRVCCQVALYTHLVDAKEAAGGHRRLGSVFE